MQHAKGLYFVNVAEVIASYVKKLCSFMKYKLVLFFIVFSNITNAQSNLIQNPSFEELDYCLNECNGIVNGDPIQAHYWFTPDYFGTPDNFSPCNFPLDTIYQDDPSCLTSYAPNSAGGFQFARTGQNYAGFLCDYFYRSTKRPFQGDLLREFLSSNFESLVKNRRYCFSSFVNTPSGFFTYDSLNYYYIYTATKELGVFFSTQKPSFSTESDLMLPVPNPTLTLTMEDSNEYIADTINWIKLEQSFVADSAYQYLSIGKFTPRSASIYNIFSNYPDINTDPTFEITTSYYFLEDVSLYEITDISISTVQTQIYPKQSVWLNTNNKTDALEWFANDTLTSIGKTDSILVQPQQTTTYYIKSLQCRYTSWDTITIEVLPEPLIPVNVKVLNNLSSDYFNIQYTGDFKPTLTAELYNSVGQLIGKFTFMESTLVPISQLSAGVYYCRINVQGIPVVSERIVKVN